MNFHDKLLQVLTFTNYKAVFDLTSIKVPGNQPRYIRCINPMSDTFIPANFRRCLFIRNP